MKILVSWLRDFVDLPPVTLDELATTLSARGFEVASLAPAPPGVQRTGGAPDGVIDIEVTANRPDCLSVFGIAREMAAAWKTPLSLDRYHNEDVRVGPGDVADLTVRVTDPDLCPRYAAALADVRVGASPPWLAARLEAAGVRPINNVVDVTNYVLMELGQPMHAFDLERLAGRQLEARRARSGERITTLDGQERTLDPEMLVIADTEGPQAIAGVIGGGPSEVAPSTRLIAFESACFQPHSVRRTAKRLGVSTDASYRFERGADVGAPVLALHRAAALLKESGAGTVRPPFIDCYPMPAEPRRLVLRHARVELLLGTRVKADVIARILTALGFDVTSKAPGNDEDEADASATWDIVVPTWRVDVSREVDLIEEVARHRGYDHLPATFPPLTVPPASPAPGRAVDRAVRRTLMGLGFSEAMTFSFIERPTAEAFAASAQAVVDIDNPLSGKFAIMRPSLIPGLVEALGHNRRREHSDVQLFEVGRRFEPGGERRSAAIAWTGAGHLEHWSDRPRPVDFFDVKAAVEQLCAALGSTVTLDAGGPAYLVTGRAATVQTSDGVTIGSVGELEPRLADALGVGAADAVYVAEIDLEPLEAVAATLADRPIDPLPRHPSVVRDLAIVIDERLPAAAIRGTIRSVAPTTLVTIDEFDRYQGPGIAAGHVSLAMRLTFRAPDRTLTDGEVNDALQGIVTALTRSHGTTLR